MALEVSPTAEIQESGGRSSSPVIPVAAILCICLTLFLFAVLMVLCIRKILQIRGVRGPNLSCSCCGQCCVGGGGGRCGEMCITAAEKLDCRGPDSQACLDSVCPSKQACSVWCGKIWSCYACHLVRDQCQSMSCASLCPGCAPCECPDLQCCGHCCHCKFKAPDCTHINCLFCDLDCGDNNN